MIFFFSIKTNPVLCLYLCFLLQLYLVSLNYALYLVAEGQTD